MTKIKDYKQYSYKRDSGANKQLNYLSVFCEKKDIDIKDHIEKNWNPSIWPLLETILIGERIDGEVKSRMNTWDKESRTLEAYLVKVFMAWVVEDYLEKWLNKLPWVKKHYRVRKGGTDALRDLKAANECTGDPDLYLEDIKTGKIIHLEVSMDNTGFVVENNCVDTRMRDNGTSKFQDMLNKSKEDNVEKVFMLILDVKNDILTFLPINENTKKVKEFQNPAWECRWCIRLEVPKNLIKYRLYELNLVA